MNLEKDPDSELKPSNSRPRRVFKWILIVGIGSAILSVTGLKAYHWTKRSQASTLSLKANEYAAQGKMQEAIMSADTALRLDPLQPVALRFMAEIYEGDGRNSQAMELYGRLYQSGSGTIEDLKRQALNALQAGYIDPAKYLAKEVAEKGESDFPIVVDAEIKIRNGNKNEALEVLRQAVKTYGGPSARLALLKLLVGMPNAENRNILIGEQITTLKDGNDAAALEALTIGIAEDILPPEIRLGLIKSLRQHPKARFPLLLFTDSIEVELDPACKPRVAAELLQRSRERSFLDRLQAAQWLIGNGHARDAVDLLPLEEALTRADAMRSWVDLAAALGEWKTLRDALAMPSNPLPGHISKIYTARAFKMAGQNAEGDALYRASLEEYKDKPADCVEILEYLYRSGEYGLFDSALPYQFAKPGYAMSTLRRLVPVVAESRDSVRVRKLFQAAEQAESLKNNNLIRNDAAYLDLVLGRGTEIAPLEKRFNENPDDPATRFTLALAKLQSGDRETAFKLAKQSRIPPQNLAPNQLMILACILAANGEGEKAIAAARLIPAARISSQELDLLKSYLLKPANR